MKNFSWKALPLLLLLLLSFISMPRVNAQGYCSPAGACTHRPTALGGFPFDRVCKTVTVQAISNSSLIAGNIVPGTLFSVTWGDGSAIESYTAKRDTIIGGICTNRLDPPPGYFIHRYPDQSVGSWKDSCVYLPILTIKNNCGTDQLTGIVNGWNKEKTSIAQTFQICRGADGTFIFNDGTLFNCMIPRYPGSPNDSLRTLIWEYGIVGSPDTPMRKTGILINGAAATFPLNDSVNLIKTISQGTPSKSIYIPVTSTNKPGIPGDVGKRFYVRLNIWNYCNPRYDSLPITATSYIEVVDRPSPVTVFPKVYCVGDSIKPLTVSGTGGAVFHWWSDFAQTKLLGTGLTYTSKLSNLVPGDSIYWVSQQVAGFAGCESVPVVDSIHVYPTLVPGTLKRNQGVCQGTIPSLLSDSIVPTGGTGVYTYQWQSSANLAGPFSNIVGQTAATYQPPALAATTYYRRQVSSGPCSATTNVITINVTPTLKAGAIGNNQSICQGTASVAFTETKVPSGGTGAFTYQWYQTTDSTLTDTLISGALSPTYLAPNQAFTRYFTRKVSSGYCSVNTNFVWIKVTPTLHPGVVAGNANLCQGQPAPPFTSTSPATGGSGVYSYQWQSAAAIGGPYNDIIGQTGLTYNPGSPAATRYYRRSVTSGQCITASDTLTITVTPTLVAPVIGTNQYICQGSTPALLTTTTPPSGGTGAFTYQWYSSTDSSTYNSIGGATATSYQPPALAQTNHYRLNVTSQFCQVTSNIVRVQVTPTVTPGTVSGSTNLCQGQTPAGFLSTAPAGGGNGTYSYQWQSSAAFAGPYNNIAGATALTYAPPAPASTTYYRRNVTSGQCNASSNVLTVTVTPTLNPGAVGSDQTLCSPGNPVPFTELSAVSGGLGAGTYSYQWKDSVSGSPYASIAGATNNVYTAPGGMTITTWFIRQVSSGFCTVRSNAIKVTLQPTLTAGNIKVPVPARICAVVGIPGTINDSISPTGGTGAYSYQWYSGTTSGGPYPNLIAGAIAINYSPPAGLTATTYFVRQVSSGVCSPLITNQVRVIVDPTLNPGVVGSDQALCGASPVTPLTQITSASGGNGTYTYQWDSAITFTGPWIAIAGTNSTTYSPPSLAVSTYFRRRVTSGVCGTAISNTVSIVITGAAPGAAGPISGPNTVCEGQSFIYGITPVPTATSYSWTLPAGATIVGPNNKDSVTINFTGASSGNVKVTPVNGCGNGPSSSRAITVNPVPVVNPVTDITTCPGVDSIKVHYTSSVAGSTFNWTNTNTQIGLALSGSGDIAAYIAPVDTSASVYTGNLSVTATHLGCTSAPVTFKINVKPTPVVKSQSNLSACPGSVIAPNAFSCKYTTGETYAWTNTNTAIGLAASGTGNIAVYNAPVDTSGAPFIGNIQVKATLNSCVSAPMNFTITVKPKPLVTVPANIIVCPGDSIKPSAFISNTPGSTFTWTNNNTSIGLAASGTGNIAHYKAPANISSFSITGTITVTATVNGCASNPISFTITIKPTPVITQISDISVCPTNSINPGNFVANTGGGTAFTWTNSNTLNGLGASGSGNITPYNAPENLSGASYDGLIKVLGTLNSCVSDTMKFHIIVKSRPTLTAETNIRKCPTQLIAPAAFASNMAGTTYSWTNTNTVIGLGASGSGNITAYNAPANISGVVQTGTITVTGTNNSCVGNPITFTIQVKPTPVITAQSNITLCPAATIAPAAFSSNTPGDTFNWTNTNVAIGLAASGTGNIASYAAPANVSGADYIGNISVLSRLENCVSSPMNFVITVHPTPVFTSTQPNIAVCPGSAITPNAFTSNVAGSTFSWTNDSTAIGLGSSGTGNITSYSAPVNTTGKAFNGHISVTASKNGCNSNLLNFTITVYPTPVVTAQANITVCPAQNISPAAFTANTSGGETFNWTNSNTAVGLAASGTGNIGTYAAPANNTGSVISSTVSVTATKNSCVSAPMTFTINLKPTPVINAQPNISVCPTDVIAPNPFTSNTTGETYAWTNSNIAIGLAASGTGSIAQYNAPANATGNPITGAISVTATLNSCVSLPMNFTITVKPKPVVNVPVDITVCPTQQINPGVFTSNTVGATFNWSNNNTSIGLAASGTGNITPYNAPANLTSFNITGIITVTATLNGCTSAPVTFNIVIKPTPVITQIADISVCPTGNINPGNFVANTGGGTTYSWTNSNISNGLAASGTGNITAYNAPENLSGSSYDGVIKVLGTINSCVSDTMRFHIIVKSRPTLGVQANIVKCPTEFISPAAFSSNMTGTTYSWTNSNAAIGLVISGSGNITPYVAPSNVSGSVVTGNISVTGTNAGCVSNPMNFQIQVKPTPVINSQSNISVCPGASIAPANFTSNTTGETYAWINSNTAIGLAASGSGNIATYPAPINISGADYTGTITVTATLNSCVSAPMNFNIDVKPTPVITSVTSIQACPGSAISPPAFVSNVAGSNFTWTNDSTIIGLAASGVGNIIPYAAPANLTGKAFNGHISVLADANGCTSSPMNFTITVKPQPVITAEPNITVCPGQLIAPVAFIANTGGGESFTWTNSNTAVGLGPSGAGNISSYNAPANNTGSVISATVTVTAQKNSCTSAPITFTINLKPTPVITTQSDIVVCKGETISATFKSNTTGETYAWTNSNAAIGLVTSGSGDILPYAAPDNLTGLNVTGNISVTATLNSCVSLPMTFNITIKPTPKITHNSNISVCPGIVIFPAPFASAPAGASFTWSNSNITIGLAPSGIGDIPAYTSPSNLSGADLTGKIIAYAVLTGCQAVPDTFFITVKAQPVVTQLSDIAVCPGVLITVPAFSSNTPGSSYAWTNTNTQIGLAGSGSGNISAYLAPANNTLSDYKGKITVTGTRNGCASTGMVFNISVHPTPQTSVIVGKAQECLDQNDFYSVTSHANSIYVWSVPPTVTVLSGGGTLYGGNPDDNFIQIQFNAAGTQNISVTETSNLTGCTGVTQNKSILINPKPIITAITGKTDVCLNETGDTYSVPSHAGSTYQWTVPTGATIISNPTLSSIIVNYGLSGGYLTAKEISAALCIGDPDTITIAIHPIPSAVPSISNQVICNKSKSLFSITTPTLPTSDIRFDYNISLSSGLTAIPSSRTGLLNNATVSDSFINASTSQNVGIYFITPRSSYCSGPTVNVSIAVQPTITILPVSTKTICNDQSPNYILNTNTQPSTSITFDYTVTVTGGVTGAIPATGLSNGSQINDVLHNPTNSIQSVTYHVVPKAFGCIGDTVHMLVYVAPSPKIISTPTFQLICDGATTNLTLTTTTLPIDSVSFSFTAISTGGVTGITPSASGLKNNAKITDNLGNATDFQQTVTYTITPKAFGCSGTPLNDTVIVSPQPKVSVTPPTQQVCSGSPTNITLTTPTNPVATVIFNYTVVATGGVTGFTTPVNGLTNNAKITDVLINSTNAIQTVTYTVVPKAGTCTGVTKTAVVTVNPMPQVIATPPTQRICNDKPTGITLTTPIIPVTSVTFNYTASTSGSVTGFTPSVTGLTNGSIIFDYLHNPANNPASVTYTITPNIGACTGNPINVVVNIDPKPTVIASTYSQAICSSTRTNFSLTTSTIPPDSVRFKYHISPLVAGVTGYATGLVTNLKNNAIVTDSLVNTTDAPQVVNYIIRPYGVGGLGCEGDSVVVVVTVNPTPKVNPSRLTQTICSGAQTNINLQTPTSPTGSVTFDYTAIATGGVTGFTSPVVGLMNNSTINDQLVNPSSSPQTVTYTITPSANSCTGISKVVTVTVNPTAQVTFVAPQTICNNTNTTIVLSTITTPSNKVRFSYTTAATGGVTGYLTSDTGLVAGYNINQTLSNPTSFPQNVTYHVTPIFAYNCPGTAIDVVVTVNPTPDISPLVSNSAICNKTATNIALTTQSNPKSSVTFNYVASTTGGVTGFSSGTGLVNNSTIADVLTNPSNTSQTVKYTITPYIGTCVGPFKDVIITVKPTPNVISTPAGQTICDGASDNFTLTTTTLPVDSVRFDYTALSTGGVTGFSSTPVTNLKNNAVVNDALHNPSNTPQTATYTITPKIFGCYGNPLNVNITVNPTPVVSPSTLAQTICSGTRTDVSLLTPTFPVSSITFDYTVTATGGVTGYTTPVNGLTNNSKIKDLLVNPGNSPRTVTYKITPKAGGCIGTPVNVVITVNPTPIATPSVLNQTICDGKVTNVILGSPTLPSAGVTFDYNVTATGSVFGFITPVTGLALNSAIADTLLNFTNTSQNVIYQVVPKAAGCTGSTVNVTIRVNPTPVINSAAPLKESCSGAATALTIGTVNLPKDSVYFSYSAVLPGGLSGSTPKTGLRVGTSGYTINENLVNATNNRLAAVYTLVPKMFGCTGSPLTLIDTVQPVPIVNSSKLTQTICDKTSTNFKLTTPTLPTGSVSFSYTASASGSVTGFASKGNLGNNDSITDVLFNLENQARTVSYVITPGTSLCNGNPITVTVTVNPTPKASVTPINSTICSESLTNFKLTTVTLPATSVRFDYTVSSTGGISGFTTPVTNLLNNAIIADKLHDSTLLAQKLTYTITPRSTGGCVGDPITASVTVNPYPVIDAGPNDTICSDGLPFLSATATGSYTSVNWFGGAGSFSNGTSLSTIYYPNVATESGKTITLYIKTSDATGICPSITDSLRLIIKKKPTLVASSVASICEKLNIPVTAIATGNYNKVRWTVVGTSVPPGGTFLNPKVLNTTYIPAIGETGITTLKVTVSDTLGYCQDVSSTVAITINPLPILNVQNSTANNQVCFGDKITFTSSNALYYHYYVNSISKQDSSLNSKFAYVPANGDKVWVRGTSAAGCSNNSDTTSIKVNPLPVVNLSSSDANNIICKGDLVTFTATGATTYKFFVGPFPVQGPSPSSQYLTNGLADGARVYAQGIDTNQCQNFSDTITTRVRELPTAEIISKDTAFCDHPGTNNVPVQILLTGTGPWSITWSDDAGTTTHQIDSIKTNKYTFYVHPTAIQTTYRLVSVMEYNGANCSGLVKPNAETVNLWELPTAQIDPKPDTIIAGKAQPFQGVVFGGSGSYPSYVWSGDSSLLNDPLAKNPSFTANSNGQFNLIFTVTDSRGCQGRDSLQMNVVISNIVIKLAWDSTEVCAGVPLELNGILVGDIVGGTGNYIGYQWKGDTTKLSDPRIRRPIFTCNVPGIYKYSFEVTDNIGTKGRDSVTILVLQNPMINFTSDTLFTCATDTVTISGHPTGGTGVYSSHSWTNQVGNFSAPNVAEPTFNSPVQADYPVTYTVTDSKGCKSNKNLVIANEAPIASFYSNAKPAGSCSPEKVLFTINPVNTLRYEWNFDDGSPVVQTTDTTVTHTFTNSALFYKTFTVSLTGYSLHGCKSEMPDYILVFPLPAFDFTPDKDSVCSNTMIQFTSIQGGAIYKWNFGKNDELAGFVNQHVFTNTALTDSTYQVTLVVIQSRTLCADTVIKPIVVHPLPKADFDVSPFKTQYPDTLFTIVNNSNIPQYQYDWTFYNDPQSETGTTVTIADPHQYAFTHWGQKSVGLRAYSLYCEDTLRRYITIDPPKPIAKFLTDRDSGCMPLTITFNNQSIYAKDFEWYFGDGGGSKDKSPTYTYYFPGDYKATLIAKGDGGRDTVAKYDIKVFQMVKAWFGLAPRVVIVPQTVVRFQNLSENGVRFIWEFGDKDTSHQIAPTHNYKDEGIYDVTLSAWSIDGCFDTYTMNEAVTAKADVKFIAPNAFTPSQTGEPDSKMSDGELRYNDQLFRPALMGVVDENYTMQIFNRWGEILFETHDLNEGWTGYYKHRLCPQDVYVWKIKYKSSTGQFFEKMGTVTLYR